MQSWLHMKMNYDNGVYIYEAWDLAIQIIVF